MVSKKAPPHKCQSSYSVKLWKCESIDDLKSMWLSVQTAAQAPCFLLWEWIGIWATHNLSKLYVLSVFYHNKPVAVGALSISRRKLFKLFSLDTCYLHRSGNDSKDQIWIEHNDFLIAKGHEEPARKEIARYFNNSSLKWDEMYIGMSEAQTLTQITRYFAKKRTVISSPSYHVDLRQCKTVDDYLGTLSSNTRSQIRRSQKLLKQEGEIKISQARNDIDKNTFFDEMASIHRLKWRTTQYGSGFDNADFMEFHHSIIMNDTENTYTALYKLDTNGNTLGYIYLLKNQTTWSFYLSAISFHSNNKIKVGLLFHTLLIDHAIRYGIESYDFLAGEARYKQSLSNAEVSEQQMVCIYRPTLLLQLDEFLRKLKRFALHLCSNMKLRQRK